MILVCGGGVGARSPHHDDALVDVGVLAEVDVVGMVAGEDGVNVEPSREFDALEQSRRVGERRRWDDCGEHAFLAVQAEVR